jgi:hypothetical protein
MKRNVVSIIKCARKREIKFDKCTIDLTVGPVVQDSAFKGLAHQGQFFPLSQSSQGSSQVPETTQLPSASGQNGGIHSQVQLTWLNMPLVQPAVGMSHRNSFPDAIAVAAAMVAGANNVCFMILCSASCGLCSLLGGRFGSGGILFGCIPAHPRQTIRDEGLFVS